MTSPPEREEQNGGFNYTTNDFSILNTYADGLIERDGIYSKYRKAELFRTHITIAAIALISIVLIVLLGIIILKFYAGSISIGSSAQTTEIEYVLVPDPNVSEVIEKLVIVEKPIYIPIEIPTQAGVVTNFTIFQSVNIGKDNVREIVTGSKYESAKSDSPIRQYCYARSTKKVGNAQVDNNIGHKLQYESPIWYSINDVQANEVGVTTRTFSGLKSFCQFIDKPQPIPDGGSSKPISPDETPQMTTGTAFAVNGSGVLVTNEHVVSACSKLGVRYADKIYLAQIRAADLKLDLALLQIAPGLLGSFVRFADQTRTGQDIVALGFPLSDSLGGGIKVTSGIVSAMNGLEGNPDQLQFTAPIQPGNSGGPLVDKSNLLVGVNVSALVGEKFQNINFAIKSIVVQRFLARHKVNFHVLAPRAAMPIPDIVDEANSYVVQVFCLLTPAEN